MIVLHARSPIPLTRIEHIHLSSSPPRHHFPHHRTHYMMKSAIVGKEVVTTALHQRSQVDRLALEHSADPNKVGFDGGPLHWHRVTCPATSAPADYSSHRIKRHTKQIMVVKPLIEYGANVDTGSKWELTAVHTAVSKGHLEIV